MRESFAADVAQNPKTAVAVSTATTAVGFSTWFQLIPTVLGIIASLLGITLTSLLIYYTVRKERLKIRILHEELKRKNPSL